MGENKSFLRLPRHIVPKNLGLRQIPTNPLPLLQKMDLSDWLCGLDEVTGKVISSFGLLRQEDLHFKPEPARWSIAENLAHLIVVNNTYFSIIREIREKTYKLPFLGKIPFLAGFLGSVLQEYVRPDQNEAKVKTFPIWEPARYVPETAILEDFEKHQQALRDLRILSEDLITTGQVIASPANPHIVYTLKDAFEVILLHEQRHLLQASAVLHQLCKTPL